jgi:hypothetical protein
MNNRESEFEIEFETLTPSKEIREERLVILVWDVFFKSKLSQEKIDLFSKLNLKSSIKLSCQIIDANRLQVTLRGDISREDLWKESLRQFLLIERDIGKIEHINNITRYKMKPYFYSLEISGWLNKDKSRLIVLSESGNIFGENLELLQNELSYQTPSGLTALTYSILKNQESVAKYLINKGSDLLPPCSEITPFEASITTRCLSLIDYFSKFQECLDGVNNYGETPLMISASCGFTDVILTLLNAGSRSSLRDKAGKTALDKAIENNHLEASLILSAKA